MGSKIIAPTPNNAPNIPGALVDENAGVISANKVINAPSINPKSAYNIPRIFQR